MVYTEGSKILISKKYIVLLSLKIDLVLAYGAGTDKMPPYVAFHLSLHCLPKYPLGVLVFKGRLHDESLF